MALLDHAAAIALSEERHFGRAARRLGVTQPALTARLRRLETTVGARLFDRGRGGVTPTEAGLAFIEGARQVLDAAEAAVEAARATKDGVGIRLRVGFTHIAAYQTLVPILDQFRQDAPHTRLTLTEGSTATLERALEQGSIDVAFLHPPLHAPGILARPICAGRLVARDFHPAGLSRPPVGVPRSDAPVLMSELDRIWDQVAISGEPGPASDADTMIGSVVLSAAGYGPAILIEDFPDFGFEAIADRETAPLFLDTSVAWRSLDRRSAVTAMVETAVGVSAAQPDGAGRF